MVYIRLLTFLLLFVYPMCIEGDDGREKGSKAEDNKLDIADLSNLFHLLQNFSFNVFNTLAKLDAGQKQDEANEEIKFMVSELSKLVKAQSEITKAQGETIEDLQQDIKDMRKSLDKRLRENDLKIEWALTDGTLAPKNTSGIMQNLARQEKKIDRSLDVLQEVHKFTYKPGSCAEINGGDVRGVHQIYPNHAYPVYASCEDSEGGGWTVIQKRFDGRVDFFRGWEEYAEGFGDPAGEYWLGLRHIHALTQAQSMELYVGVTDFDLGLRYAKYSSFSVSSEEDKFRLHVGTYSGNASDSLTYHSGERFSTKDQDNDPDSNHCSSRYHGAWWYKNCHYSNLNGRFSKVKVNDPNYMSWYHLHNTYWAMKASVMMIRPFNFKT